MTARGEGGGRLGDLDRDTGPGIPADQLETDLRALPSLDGGRSRDSGGSGLGLAIARALVEAHDGTITVESEPGHGATFRIVLPGFTGTS